MLTIMENTGICCKSKISMIKCKIFYKDVVELRMPERLWLKLGLLLICATLLALWYFWDLPCIPRVLTGIPCPTCGLTRAWLCALRLDLPGAFSYYPMFWCVPILGLYLIFDGELFRNLRLNYWVLGCLLGGIFLIWLARLFGFSGALAPL